MTLRTQLSIVACIMACATGTLLAGCSWTPPQPPVPAPTAREAALATVTADYATPEDAVKALMVVLANPSPNAAATLFGPSWMKLQHPVPSEAQGVRAAFLARLERGYSIDRIGNGAILVVGGADDPDRFPFAVPLIERSGRWKWDTDAGIEEFRMRRIGRNELETIAAMEAIAAAQRAYFEMNPQGTPVRQYALRIRSSDGAKDGLHWATAGGAEPSPIGPGIAEADCSADASKAKPFKGYRYAALASQGAGAPGGAMPFADAQGRAVSGWAVIAWPEVYGQTGIMSFMVGPDGVVVERDLGPDTSRAMDIVTAFDPSAGWSRCGTPAPGSAPSGTAPPAKAPGAPRAGQ